MPPAGELRGAHLGDPKHPVLGRRVVREAWCGNQTRARRGVDDGPTTLGDHLHQLVLHAQEDRGQVHGDHPGPTRPAGELEEGFGGVVDTGVVPGAVESTLFGQDAGHHLTDAHLVGHVLGHEGGLDLRRLLAPARRRPRRPPRWCRRGRTWLAPWPPAISAPASPIPLPGARDEQLTPLPPTADRPPWSPFSGLAGPAHLGRVTIVPPGVPAVTARPGRRPAAGEGRVAGDGPGVQQVVGDDPARPGPARARTRHGQGSPTMVHKLDFPVFDSGQPPLRDDGRAFSATCPTATGEPSATCRWTGAPRSPSRT